MKKNYRLVAILLLIINGISASAGGWSLIADPSGKTIGFAIGMLTNTPFPNYLIPGIFLFSLIGLSSIVITLLAVYKVKNYPWFIFFQGLVLAIWLSVEVVVGFYFPFLHIPYYAIAILLMITGFMLISPTTMID